MVSAIIAAAGAGKRMGEIQNKILLKLDDVPILVRSCRALAACREIGELIIAVAQHETVIVENMLAEYSVSIPYRITIGGKERQDSINAALKEVSPQSDIVLVHDAARPLVEVGDIERLIAAAREYRAAGLAVPVKDTIKKVNDDVFSVSTPPRESLWAIQTPQAFSVSVLKAAYVQAERSGHLGTDDAGLVERMGIPVKLVEGRYTNIKITTPEDMLIASAFLKAERENVRMRVGIGYDVHRLVEGRKLILGGVEIPYELGLDGHSDADVLLHAVKDAMLGAAALGDIGRHFPDTDGRYKGISSLILLKKVNEIIMEKGFFVNNIDAVVMAQKPKLAGFIPQMITNIADTINIDSGMINIKATTTERLGFCGRGEGMAAEAVVTLARSN